MRSRWLSMGIPCLALLCVAGLTLATGGSSPLSQNIRYHAPQPYGVNPSSIPMVNADGTVRWPDGRIITPAPSRKSNIPSSTLGASSPTSPGIVICGDIFGGTTYDYQHNDANQRTIATLPDGGTVHFTYTYWDVIPDSLTGVDRFVNYNCWTPSGGLGQGNCGIIMDVTGDPLSARQGYSTIAVNSEDLAHVAFHFRDSSQQPLGSLGLYSSWVHNQGAPCVELFAMEQMPQSESYELIWPHIAVDRNPDAGRRSANDVYHVTARETAGPFPTVLPLAITYWRRVGDWGGTWEGPVVLDEHTTGTYNHYVAVDPAGDKVAVIYERNDLDPDDLLQVGYLESPDNGANWIAAGGFPNPIEPIVGPYINITNYTGPDGINPQAWTECAGDYDLDGVLHIVWVEQIFANESKDSRIKHWDEINGTRTVVQALNWANSGLTGGRDLWLSLPNIAFGDGSTICNGGPRDQTNYNYVYVTYQQYGGPTPTEANDVSSPGYQNLDLYLSVSNDSGATWAQPVNLTNTKTPGCDGSVMGSECASERDPSPAKIVNDTLHLAYILDTDAGDMVFGQGSWTYNPVMYYRIRGGTDAQFICPEIAPRILADLSDADPDCEYHAALNAGAGPQQVVEQLTIQNLGNGTLTGVVSENPSADWLDMTTGGYTIPIGDPPDTRAVTLDATASSVQSGGEGLYQSSIEITHDDPAQTSPIVIPVDFFVFDDFYCPEYLTLNTGWLWLTVSNIERVANEDPIEGGLVRLDPTVGDLSYGIYDGSLVIGVPPNPDTLVYRTVYGSGNGANGFRALGPLDVDTTAYGTNIGYASARASQTTSDSLLGIEVEYIFPQDPDSCEFVLIEYAITNTSASAMTGLAIGQATDFDVVPGNDLGAIQIGEQNDAVLFHDYNLIYQTGADTTGHVIVGDQTATRFKAGVSSVSCLPSPRAWIAPTDPWLTKRPGQGFHEGYLWQEMIKPGFEIFPPDDPNPEEDLHGVMVFEKNVDLDVGETAYYTMAYVSSNTGTDASDLIATTKKAWQYAFGWQEFTTYDSLPLSPPDTVSYPYRALGTHEDGLAGGCCGCIVTEIDDPDNVFEIVPDANPCTGTITLIEPNEGCLYRATFRVTDLCGETSDDIVIEVISGGHVDCWCNFQGDINLDGVYDAVDLNALIDILFFNGTDPQDPQCPATRGDLNADGVTDAVDLNYMIEMLFFNGPGPVDPCVNFGC